MADRNMGSTAKLVGAMMRLRHNTKFKGGLDLGGAPSSMASAREHLLFLQAFGRQLRQQKEDAEGDEEIAGDGDMLTAKFAETQIRALVNSELEACVVLHESEGFWQQRLERSWASVRNWIEMGPQAWTTHGLADCGEEYMERLGRCRQLLRIKILSAGSLQLHLTQMKQAYMDGTLGAWNLTALAIIRQALEAKETLGGLRGSSDGHRHASGASAARSPYPRWGSLGSKGTGADSTGWQSFLSRIVNASLTGRSFSSRYLERGQSLGVSNGSGADRVGGGADESYVEAPVASLDRRGVSTGGQGAPSPVRIVGRGVGRGGNEAPADLAELLRDARDEELGDGNGEDGKEEGNDDDERGDDEGGEGIMEALLDTSERLVAVVQTQQEGTVPMLLGSSAPPSIMRRNWLSIAVATPAVLVAMLYMYRHRTWIRRSSFMVRGSLRQFVHEHISEPFWGIYNELVHNQPLTMTDANALADSSQSLKRMLKAFIKDTKPDLSQGEVNEMAATGDMSVVSREYEKSIIKAWKNFVAGDIVRMMLIQVQFIKRELLIATTAIGQLARENELNLRMMATVPAFLLAWGSYRAVRPVYYMLKSEKSRESTFTAMRTIVLAMERLLNLRHREGTWLQLTEDLPELPAREDREARVEEGVGGRRTSLLPSGQSDNCTRQVVLPAGPGQGLMAVRVLDELDLGKLMLLVHQVRVDDGLSAFDVVAAHLREFRRLIRSGPRRFQRVDLINCQEDLAELVGERGLMSVGQQLAIVQRMQRSYMFLLPRR